MLSSQSKSRRRRYLRLALLTSLVGALALSSLISFRADAADTIEFPDDELASESVLPVFDHAVSVKNRKVLTQSRFEVGPTLGLSLLEPFYNPLSIGLVATYHKTEEHAYNFVATYFMQGLSNNANGLNPIPGTVTPAKPAGTNMNLQYAPAPKYMLLANYQYTGFYGKLSLGKDAVVNLSVFGLGGIGVMGVGDAFDPAVNIGIGQKLYFSPNLAFRFDFRFIAYQGPDVLSALAPQATSIRRSTTRACSL
jgi:outer membrane beta-barrel protein